METKNSTEFDIFLNITSYNIQWRHVTEQIFKYCQSQLGSVPPVYTTGVVPALSRIATLALLSGVPLALDTKG